MGGSESHSCEHERLEIVSKSLKSEWGKNNNNNKARKEDTR